VVFVGESGFYLLPAVLRTYAPVGQTPIIRAYLGRDHLSAISGITREGKLCMCVQDKAYNSTCVISFLDHLLRHTKGKLLVIWDGYPIRRSRVVKVYLAAGAAKRIHLERFPAFCTTGLSSTA